MRLLGGFGMCKQNLVIIRGHDWGRINADYLFADRRLQISRQGRTPGTFWQNAAAGDGRTIWTNEVTELRSGVRTNVPGQRRPFRSTDVARYRTGAGALWSAL